MRWRRIFFGLIAALLLCLVVVGFLHYTYRPAPLSRTEIYKGVFLTVDELPKSSEGRGKMMVVEVHWDTPGVRIANRPFDYQFSPENPISPHYDLEFADLGLRRLEAEVLVNTAIYIPGELYNAWPGRPVRTLETLVVDGRVSSVHEHSYLLYWDALNNVHLQQTKPPSEESLANAVTGIGLQGIQINAGQAGYGALDGKEHVGARTFIGVDPLKRILYLFAYEKVSGYTMIDQAVRQGVIFGGQLDTGTATHLIIGKDARGVKAHTGIRSFRPIGPYLTIQAEPL
ncbi:MAG: hypothetical protein AB3N63_12940 [Puniceicoccaceae bacterium]